MLQMTPATLLMLVMLLSRRHGARYDLACHLRNIHRTSYQCVSAVGAVAVCFDGLVAVRHRHPVAGRSAGLVSLPGGQVADIPEVSGQAASGMGSGEKGWGLK